MAWRDLGYSPGITVINNGAGNCRITWPAWNLDWELFGEISVAGSWYVNNQTRTVAGQITAKGGTESGGYYVDINVAFPSANWVDGDRCMVRGENSTLWHTTHALLLAAAADGDIVVGPMYANTSNGRFWALGFGAVTVVLDIRNGLSLGQIFVGPNDNYLSISADWTGKGKTYIRGIYFSANSISHALSYYNDTGAAKTGDGMLGKRCVCVGGYLHYNGSGKAQCVQIENCLGIGCYRGITQVAGTAGFKLYNTTFIDGWYGVTCAAAVANVLTGVVCFGQFNSCFGGTGASTVTYCASSDATAGAGAGCINNLTAAQADFWFDDTYRANNLAAYGFFTRHPGILTTSSLYHTGTPIAGVTTDMFGNARHGTTPSIGCHEGTSEAFPRPAGATPSGTAITALACRAGNLEATFGAGTNADLYAVFVREGAAIDDWTITSARLVQWVPGGQTIAVVPIRAPGATLLHDETYYVGVRGYNLASGTLDTNTTELTIAVTPKGVGVDSITVTALPNVTVADVLAFAAKPVLGDIEKLFGAAALSATILDIQKLFNAAAIPDLNIADIKEILGAAAMPEVTLADLKKVFGKTTLSVEDIGKLLGDAEFVEKLLAALSQLSLQFRHAPDGGQSR